MAQQPVPVRNIPPSGPPKPAAPQHPIQGQPATPPVPASKPVTNQATPPGPHNPAIQQTTPEAGAKPPIGQSTPVVGAKPTPVHAIGGAKPGAGHAAGGVKPATGHAMGGAKPATGHALGGAKPSMGHSPAAKATGAQMPQGDGKANVGKSPKGKPALMSVAETPKHTPLDATTMTRGPAGPTSQYPTTLHTTNVTAQTTVSVGSELTDKADSEDSKIARKKRETIKVSWRRLAPWLRRLVFGLCVFELILCVAFVALAIAFNQVSNSNSCDQQRDSCYAKIVQNLKTQHRAGDGLLLSVHR